MRKWQVAIDTGGTFTDCIAVTPSGEILRLKVLSSAVLRVKITKTLINNTLQLDWPVQFTRNYLKGFTIRIGKKKYNIVAHYHKENTIVTDGKVEARAGDIAEISTGEEVPVFAIRILTQTSPTETIPPCELRLGSTKGMNALLERKGARVVLVTTKGFKDVLLIGNQQRPDLFSLAIHKEPPLYSSVIEIDERVNSQGDILAPVSSPSTFLSQVRKRRFDSIALALLNSYKNPVHEQLLSKALGKYGDPYVSLSSELSSHIGFLSRVQTTVVNAYLQPIIKQYVESISRELGQPFLVMTSSGGLVLSSRYQPKDSLLSGPAGGVTGALIKAKKSGVAKIITFDMGGTSTDVSLCDGRPEFRFESRVGPHTILSPSIAIETIAAGGGSICAFDGHRLTVGPESAGAEPGPACYGKGGPLTITDVNLLLGRLDPANFSIPIDEKASAKRLDEIMKEVNKSRKEKIDRESLLDSFIRIANEKMAEAIRKVSIKQGHHPAEFSLVSFGGAGGQHACALADVLGIDRMLAPYDAGLLSAYGIGQSSVVRISERLILEPLSKRIGSIDSVVAELHQQNVRSFEEEGVDTGLVQVELVLLFLRLRGQETSIEVDITSDVNIEASFNELYEKLYSTPPPDRPIEIESLRVLSAVKGKTQLDTIDTREIQEPVPYKSKQVYNQRKWRLCDVYRWEDLTPGIELRGPVLVTSDNSTLWVENGWKFVLNRNQNAELIKFSGYSGTSTYSKEAELELYMNRFTAIASDMGAVLQRTSFSVNVKERLDFSCALLDRNGCLIVNAPHIPVHLGSLGVCVRAVSKVLPLHAGDVVITNHPAYGGSHLPDITLIKPVYFKGSLVGYVANRAHHAEIGGRQPGSMPVDATTLVEEGVIIPPTYLVRGGKTNWKGVEHLLTAEPFPTRLVHENIADLSGALASLSTGEKLLEKLCAQHGVEEVTLNMQRIFELSTSYVNELLRTFPKRTLKAVERLDDGSRLSVNMYKKGRFLHIDFDGTSGLHSGNLNATPAIVQSVILYVMRILLNRQVPLNEGLMRLVRVHLPTGMLNPGVDPEGAWPAVVGGNTEVSQRLTDTFLKALKLSACSQGTMNNLIFGNESFGFYETIGGGTGAGPGFNGCDAIHQHMTNTRITDPEIMEYRYPVQVIRFEIRKGSGGKGKYKGGNGIVRELLFKKELSFNILSQHRKYQPYGMNGGEHGKSGEQYVHRSNGKKVRLDGMDGGTLMPGDTLVVKTPGGGGWGKVSRRR